MNESLLDLSETQTADPNKSYYEQLVGEGLKFKDNEALARGKWESDLYVKHLEKRLDEAREDYMNLREEYNAGPKLRELIDQLSTTQPPQSRITQSNEENKPVEFDLSQVESLVAKKVQEIESSKKQSENFRTVQNKLKERFGDNYSAVLKQQVESLGLTPEFADSLAKQHPAVFMKTFGLEDQPKRESFQAPPRSVQSDNFTPSTNKRTWSYYQKMRKEQPDLYRDQKTQVQMHKDALELGDAFQDGNWDYLGRL